MHFLFYYMANTVLDFEKKKHIQNFEEKKYLKTKFSNKILQYLIM